MEKHFVHRDKYSHYKRRYQFKRWKKQGRVTVVKTEKDGWVYAATDGFVINKEHGRREVKFSVNPVEK